MSKLGQLYTGNPQEAVEFAHDLAELMALEVQSVGCDISFAPVLDLGGARSKVIGNRAFSTSKDAIIELARAFICGMQEAGMASTGKHFPGHGSIEADSHVLVPYDRRCFDDIYHQDLQPFIKLSSSLDAVMPAHIIYSQVDPQPAGFSKFWLQQVLRQQLGFQGVVFSDDLSMKGAAVAGGFCDRAEKALAAGCDMVLVCNNRGAAIDVVESLQDFKLPQDSQSRLLKMTMKSSPIGLDRLKQTPHWQYLSGRLQEFNHISRS